MKLSRFLLTAAAAMTLAACGNISNITDDGVPAGNTAEEKAASLVWKPIEEVTLNNNDTSRYGTWPEWDKVRSIKVGMEKEQIRALIGNPHFSEGLYNVREWDYVFNYNENGEHKVCQYKVLFDTNMIARSLFWHPTDCFGSNNNEALFTLSGDFLFDFDRDTLTKKGQQVVSQLASKLKDMQAKSVKVAGFTDRLGSESYNLGLSQRRADVVKAALLQRGVDADILAVGYGKAKQVKSCNDVKDQRALRECLRPNRRVEVSVSGSEVKATETVKQSQE